MIGPILAFLVVSAFASPLLAKMQDVLGLDPQVLRLTVFSTAIGAGVVWAIWRNWLRLPAVTRVDQGRALLASMATWLLAAGALLLLAKSQHAPWGPPSLRDLGAPFAVVLLVQLVGAAAEEVGWRGLVQPMLETRLRPSWAALITGLLFAVGHFYVAFSVSPLACVLFVVSAIALSLILAAVTVGRSIGARILIATSLHFLINMATFLLFADGDGSVRYFADQAIVFGALGAIAFVWLARRPAAGAT